MTTPEPEKEIDELIYSIPFVKHLKEANEHLEQGNKSLEAMIEELKKLQ